MLPISTPSHEQHSHAASRLRTTFSDAQLADSLFTLSANLTFKRLTSRSLLRSLSRKRGPLLLSASSSKTSIPPPGVRRPFGMRSAARFFSREDCSFSLRSQRSRRESGSVGHSD